MQNIDSFAKSTFDGLKADNNLQGLPKDQFLDRAAHHLGEINALHPFRDGSGRTQASCRVSSVVAESSRPCCGGESPSKVAQSSKARGVVPKRISICSQYSSRRPFKGVERSRMASIILLLPPLFSPTKTVSPRSKETISFENERKLLRSTRLRCICPRLCYLTRYSRMRVRSISRCIVVRVNTLPSVACSRRRMSSRRTLKPRPAMQAMTS